MGDPSPDIFDTEEEGGRNKEYLKEEEKEKPEKKQEEEEEKRCSFEEEGVVEDDEPDYDPRSPLCKEVLRISKNPMRNKSNGSWTGVNTKQMLRMLLLIPCYL